MIKNLAITRPSADLAMPAYRLVAGGTEVVRCRRSAGAAFATGTFPGTSAWSPPI